MSFSNDLFWSNVSGTHEKQAKTASLVHAKVAAATWWPFLSHAVSETDFENRLSLVSNKIESSVGTDLYDEVVSSLRDDYRAVTAASEKASLACGHAECVTGLPCKREDPETWEKATGRKESSLRVVDEDDLARTAEKAPRLLDSEHPGARKEINRINEANGHRVNVPIAEWHQSNPNARDYSHHKEFTCKNHPDSHFTSKNPYDRSLFVKPGSTDCNCPIDDLMYTGAEGHSKTAAGDYEFGDWHKCSSCNGTGGKNDECSDCDGNGRIRELKKKSTNYQPDPNKAWRYYAPYENIDGANQVNNGALQDSDGFPIDLAQGEDVAAQQRMQFQLTPGTWTEHDGMPERPMPFSQQRGYHPVNAAREDFGGWATSYWDMGQRHANNGEPPHGLHKLKEPYANAYRDGYLNGYSGQHRESAFDAEGFLVEASDVAQEYVRGRGVEPLVDPVPGATQRVNPYYFNDDAAMGANDGFPVQPTEDPQDRMNEIYGETAPQASQQDTSSSIDGNGYSRSYPGQTGAPGAPKTSGQSPNFSAGGRTARRDVDPEDRPSDGDLAEMAEWDRRKRDRHADLDDGNPWSARQQYGNWTDDDPWNEKKGSVRLAYDEYDRQADEDQDRLDRHMEWQHLSGEHGFEPHRDCYMCQEGHKTGAWLGQDKSERHAPLRPEERGDTRAIMQGMQTGETLGLHGHLVTKRFGGDDPHFHVSHEDGSFACMGSPGSFLNHLTNSQSCNTKSHQFSFEGSTDGKIVDHCPGCEQPRRVHATPHGDEIRHLHNNHVRCHGDRTAKVKKKAAVPYPNSTITHPVNEGEPYHVSCEKCGPVVSHPSYDIAHAIATDHSTQHWVAAHDDKFGQGAHAREFPWLYQGALTEGERLDRSRCQCEHASHHGSDANNNPYPKTGHDPYEAPSGRYRAQYVGPICDRCAMTHMKDWLVGSHQSALSNGGNIDGHERPLTFQEGLEYNGQYGVHTAEGQLSNGSVHTADYLGRPDATNPTGRGADEYEARNWDAYSRQRPMQSPDDRNVNTPVLGREPLRTRDVNTPTPGLKDHPAGRDGEDEEEDDE